MTTFTLPPIVLPSLSMHLTDDDRAKIDKDVESIHAIMGHSPEARMTGMLVTSFIRGFEIGLGSLINPLRYFDNIKRAAEYGERLGYRIGMSL